MILDVGLLTGDINHPETWKELSNVEGYDRVSREFLIMSNGRLDLVTPIEWKFTGNDRSERVNIVGIVAYNGDNKVFVVGADYTYSIYPYNGDSIIIHNVDIDCTYCNLWIDFDILMEILKSIPPFQKGKLGL